MSGPITRETFISAEQAMKNASQLPKMWVIDGDDIKEVPVPSSVKKTGILPEGYTYGQGLLATFFEFTDKCLICFLNVPTWIVRFHP